MHTAATRETNPGEEKYSGRNGSATSTLDRTTAATARGMSAEERRTARREQQEAEHRQQQQEEHWRREQREEEHRQFIQVQMLEALKAHRPTVEPRIHLAPFEKNEDFQNFLEAFEGIEYSGIDQKEWVLRLALLLKEKARAACTDVGAMLNYDGVKNAILSHYSISPEWCRRGFRAHTWKRDAEPNA